MFLANQATLTPQVVDPSYTAVTAPGRIIYSATGTSIQKPKLSIAAFVIISLLLFLQVLGVAILAYLIYRRPTETRVLDARAVARIVADMEWEEKEEALKSTPKSRSIFRLPWRAKHDGYGNVKEI